MMVGQQNLEKDRKDADTRISVRKRRGVGGRLLSLKKKGESLSILVSAIFRHVGNWRCYIS